jgi:hypothetical protein
MFDLSCRNETGSRVGASLSRRSARLVGAAVAVFCVCASGVAFLKTYDADFFPENFLLFDRTVYGTPERRLENGWLILTVEEGDKDTYRYDLGGIGSLVGRFFVEWRAVTDYPEWLIHEWQVPAVVSAAGNGPFYHVVMTKSAAALTHFDLTRTIVPITASQPHTHRIEVFADQYLWYIDGVVVNSGVPVGPYPDPNAFITWGIDGYKGMANTTAFDYIRLGEIPQPASGDYDSNLEISSPDYRFVHDCLAKAGPDLSAGPYENTGPGCAFTDFDFDLDVDLFDFAEFASRYTGYLP